MKKQDIFEKAARDDSTYLYSVEDRLNQPANEIQSIQDRLRPSRVQNIEEEPYAEPAAPPEYVPAAGGSGYIPSSAGSYASGYPSSEFNSDWLAIRDRLGNQAIGMNYEDWTQGSDYASLAKRYADSGRLAMQDTLGQVSARTGGLASSYAGSAAQQSYNAYMNQLQDVARALYQSQKNEIIGDANMANSYLGSDYDRWSDQYNRELNKYQWEQEQNGQVAQLKAKLAAVGSSMGGTSSMTYEEVLKKLYDAGKNYGDDVIDSIAGELVSSGKADETLVSQVLNDIGYGYLTQTQEQAPTTYADFIKRMPSAKTSGAVMTEAQYKQSYGQNYGYTDYLADVWAKLNNPKYNPAANK